MTLQVYMIFFSDLSALMPLSRHSLICGFSTELWHQPNLQMYTAHLLFYNSTCTIVCLTGAVDYLTR